MTDPVPTPTPPAATTPAKAIVGAVLTLAFIVVQAVLSGGVSWSDLITALIGTLVTGGAVYQVPNRPKASRQ